MASRIPNNTFEYVIVGAGSAVLTACQELVRSGINKQCKICLISSDNHLLHGHIPLSKHSVFKKGWALTSIRVRQFLFQQMIRKYCETHGIISKLSTITKHIDYQHKTLTTDQGDTIRYNTLLLATHRLRAVDGQDTPLYGVNIEYALSQQQLKQCVFRNISYLNVNSTSHHKILKRTRSNPNMHYVIITKWHEELRRSLFYLRAEPRVHFVKPEAIDSFISDVNGDITSVKIQNGTIIDADVISVEFRASSNIDLLRDFTHQKELCVNKWLQSESNSNVFICGDYYFLSKNDRWKRLEHVLQEVHQFSPSSSALFAVRSMTNTLSAKQKQNGYRKGLVFVPYPQFDAQNMITVPNRIRMHAGSYPEIILNVANHLICGFIRNEQNHFPLELQQCIWMYFMRNFLSVFAFNDDGFSELQPLRQDQVLHIVMKLLCPGDNTQHKHVLHGLFNTTLGISDSTKCSHASSIPRELSPIIKVNVSILSEYAQICEFYSVLGEDLNHGILSKALRRALKPSIGSLIIGLIQNKGYYQLYLRIIQEESEYNRYISSAGHRIIDMVQNTFTVQHMRRLLIPLVLEGVALEYHHTFDGLSLLFTIMRSLPTNLNEQTQDLCYSLKWRWLEKEIEAQLAHTNDTMNQNEECKESLRLLSNECITYVVNNVRNKASRFTCSCVFDVLYLLHKCCAEINLFDYNYSFTHWNDFAELIDGLLRAKDGKYSGVGAVGFTLLQMEVNKWRQINHEYRYREQLLSFIETRADHGLFQLSVVNCLDILKGTKDGNIENAMEQLEKATRVFYDINQMLQLRSTKANLSRFDRFYRKVKATKLIKPIIPRLESDIESS